MNCQVKRLGELYGAWLDLERLGLTDNLYQRDVK